MAQPIIIKRSSVANKVPLTTDLQLGELAINTYDGKLYLKKNNGTESIVQLGAGGGGGASVTVSTTAPASPTSGDLWWDSSAGVLKIYYTDSDSSQWVDASPYSIAGSGGVGDLVGPASATDNAIARFDGTTGKLVQNSGVVIDDSGNLGIGTTPSYRLDVSATGNISGRVKTSGALNAFYMEDAGTTAGTLYIGSVGNDWRVVTGSNERMRVDGSGNVGIGTTAPSSKFVVSNSGAAGFEVNPIGSASAPAIYSYNRGTNAYDILTAISSEFRWQTGSSPSESMRIDSAGNVGIGASAVYGKLNIANGSNNGFEFYPNNTAATNLILNYDRIGGVYQNLQTRAATHQFLIGAVEAARIDASGNVGIGTSSPGGRLDVRDTAVSTAVVRATSVDSIGRLILQNDARYWDVRCHSDDTFLIRDGTADLTRIAIDTSGNVGIGTSTPQAILQSTKTSAGAIAVQALLHNADSTNGTGAALDFSALSGTGSTSTGRVASVRDGSGAYSLRFYTYGIGGGALTEAARIDSAGNVGIGTAPSAWGSTLRTIQLGTASDQSNFIAGYNGAAITFIGSGAYFNGTNWIRPNATNLAARYDMDNGVHKWLNGASGTAGTAISFTQAMTLDASGNLMVGGTTAVEKLTVTGNIVTNGSQNYVYNNGGSGSAVNSGFFLDGSGSTLRMFTGNSERARIDSSGNVGIGVTPSAWSGFTGVDINSVTALASASNRLQLAYNSYWNGANYIYKTTDAAMRYDMQGGTHQWFTAASGTAGAAISFTQAMTLDSAGNLLVGTTTSSARLNIFSNTGSWNSAVRFTNTTNTSGFDVGLLAGPTDATAYVFQRANSAMLFGTNNTERLRIADTGAFGLSGANYGTSGQVLTSQGSGSAPIWTTVSGGSFSLAADTGTVQTISGGDTLTVTGGTGINTSTGTDAVTLDVDTTVIATVASLSTVATTGQYADILNTPTLSTVATSGSYNDLTGKPTVLALTDIANVTLDIHGIVDRTASTISFTDATRTFTITPVSGSWTFYYKGTLYTVSAAKSIAIANTSGARFIKIDPATLNLVEGGATPDFINDVIVGYVYYDTTSAKALIVGDERHSSARDTTWHSNQHLNVGTVWRSGGALAYTLNNVSAVTVEVGAPLVIADEDLLHTITHSATPSADYQQILTGAASLEVVYLSGTSYTSTAQSTTPWIAGTTRARYNQITGGSGSLVDATEGSYVTYWLLATNDIRRPVKLVLGRSAHATLDAAYAESFEEYGLSFAEQVFMYQIVLQTSTSYANTAKVILAGVRKVTSKIANSVSTLPATSHNSMTGRDATDAHPISAITGLQSALDGKQKLITVSTTAPSSPSVGDLWVDTN